MYIIRFIFTVSITLTGIIFCAFLAPFSPPDYNAWTFSSYLTHVISPLLSIIDFFLDDYAITLKKSHVFLALIPPAFYFVISCTLSLLKFDFGRGQYYPYFFMDIYSSAGFFGFEMDNHPPVIGTAYWLIFILGFILLISFILYKFHSYTRKTTRTKKKYFN